ncbi:insulinase family protein [Aureibaculum sp. 2210JD6-5]|uniref:M16 family metallopeptidase n=1 Tax=Aureibaculum sp. 2210JD6-5 TaxID=3103957 RepID=UPI002AAE1C77|nr:insulinase family protein [Aureibaculum sp. 2210JD6-5]MDY7396348.1 insulinase family protein [Aureibaculum sp. 2210JD6-5]
MKKIQLLFVLAFLAVLTSCKINPEKNSNYVSETHADANSYTYKTVKNDPTGLRLYTLDNGLKVYLSKNTDEPKIQTFIAVRAGSNYDPKETTGLAHYLEHMLFKGTDKFGTADWENEKKYLAKISDLYEQHKAENDIEKKKAIYRQIDSVSLEASKFAIANEYDKMTASLGAQGTNAHTWVEETVYQNKIPANELEKWLNLESERFSKLVLRLFHTELEAVYEEFNRGQDNDFRKKFSAMLAGLFPNHPYGQQTTIGTSEHLKNPSMVAINNYFEKYYVPNNMALVLVGDLDFDKTIKMVDSSFGKLKKKEVVHPDLPKESPITEPIIKEVFGPTAESMSLTFRTDKIGSQEEKLVTLVDMLLANSQAGLFDLNLNQQQKVQRAGSFTIFFNDYGLHNMDGTPKAGQSLEEVKDLMLEQIEKIKKGEFEDWMLDAVVNDLKLSQTRQYESNTALASAYFNAFIHRQDWKDRIQFLDDLKKITKQEVVDFANKFYKNNYVVVYKKQGEDKNIVKVENPGITPIEVNRDMQSDFVKNFNAQTSEDLKPRFVDYKNEIKNTALDNGLEVAYVENKNNDLFDLNIIFDMGSDNNKQLSLAVGYLDFLGTASLSPEDVKKEFYKLGISYGVQAQGDKSYVYISGLKENLAKGLKLLEDLWDNAEADQESYNKYVAKILKDREDNKTQKSNILWNGLFNYAKYGENSRLRNIYTAEELRAINPTELVALVKDLKNYKQRVFYYGKDVEAAVAAMNDYHKLPENLKDYPDPIKYEEKETGDQVYFTDYDMVQSELVFVSKGKQFDPKELAASRVFNAYFGSGLSSIVFQEIRESKSLAYSAFAAYADAGKKDDSNYIYAYVGTQANKLTQAVDAMLELMNDMPKADKQFQAAKESVLKQIAAERITKSNIFWSYEGLKNRGIDYDNREEIYNEVKKMTLEDLSEFFNENIKGNKYTSVVIGNKKDLKVNALKKLGKIKELDVDYLFNYKITEIKQ